MLTFLDFARGPGGEVARRLGVPCDRSTTWGDYTARFLRHARDSRRYASLKAEIGVMSTGETAVACALLHAVDLSALADEMSAGLAWQRLNCTFGGYRRAVVAALLRLDTAATTVKDDEDEEADFG
ncbi:hypothetical protein [Azospirillum griseum]|uniref:Uncharacterized protein n=1 Tax=Azospirillum griseum TaxID=2496639 RepID=A0A3S0JKW3_9PROT|nr:hypothetical protein [Azospirillum griseum]RTR23056.1 hypothetical protein EJ903_05685 [Azospirillum griseum]